ncbi:unnamed protein product [Rhodiola kirilowii]
MESNNQQQFWQFSDKLRGSNHLAPSPINNDSIWSTTYVSKRTDLPRNNNNNNNADFNVNHHFKSPINDDAPKFLPDHFNHHVDSQRIDDFSKGFNSAMNLKSDFNNNNGFNSAMNLKTDFNSNGFVNSDYFANRFNSVVDLNQTESQKSFAVNNGGFNKGVYSKNYNTNTNNSIGFKNYNKNNKQVNEDFGVKFAGKKNGNKNYNNNNNSGGGGGGGVEKRFKTLPPSESLPRNETVGGYIFVCNNDTMQENLQRQLFGLPPRYRDSVRAITPGLPLFLYNYSTHQLHGVFEAASFGGSNIDPMAWEDKKCPGESRFPAQVKVVTRKLCEPLEEDSFRPILHHYDGPKFRLELNIPEALSLLDIFEEETST